MGTQDRILRDIERIRQISARMVGRGVEAIKDVEDCLNLRAFRDAVAHGHKDAGDLLHRDGQRMLDADTVSLAGLGDVDAFLFKARLLGLLFEFGHLFVDQGVDFVLGFVGSRSDGLLFLFIQLAHHFEDVGNLALLAQESDSQLLDVFRRRGLRDLFHCFVQDLLDSFLHVVTTSFLFVFI